MWHSMYTPFFGNKDFQKIRTIYSVPQDTMKKGLYREEYISKWLSFVRNMKLIDILNTIPEKIRNHIVKQLRITEGTSYYPKMNQLGLKVFENKVKYEQKYLTFSQHKPETAPMLLATAKRKGTTYITSK